MGRHGSVPTGSRSSAARSEVGGRCRRECVRTLALAGRALRGLTATGGSVFNVGHILGVAGCVDSHTLGRGTGVRQLPDRGGDLHRGGPNEDASPGRRPVQHDEHDEKGAGRGRGRTWRPTPARVQAASTCHARPTSSLSSPAAPTAPFTQDSLIAAGPRIVLAAPLYSR